MIEKAYLTRCRSCRIPQVECFGHGYHHQMMKPAHMVFENNNEGYPSSYISEWVCQKCFEEGSIRCSHCDDIMPDDISLDNPLDDGSFLCKKCDTQLKEELDGFTGKG